MQHEVLTRKETAALLRCSLVTLDRLANAGKISKIQLTPRRIGILKSDITAYLQSQRIGGTACA